MTATARIPFRDESSSTRRERAAFNKAQKAEAQYARHLRQIAKQVGEIIRGMAPGPGDLAASTILTHLMERYAEIIRPWARATAARMIADVARRDEVIWTNLGKDMSRALKHEIQTAPTGHFLRGMLEENVSLITSLPTEAARRVHELTLKGLESSARASTIAKEIQRSGEVTTARANLIARTEVARTASGLTEARAIHVGSEGYIWRTAGDSDVRKEHKALNGKFIKWNEPPVAGSRGERAHAGQIYNCRCYPEPVIPD